MTAQAELSVASELRLGTRASELAGARGFAHAAAVACALSAEDSYDFVYAVNEAVTNAIRHGSPDEQGQILLSVSATDEWLVFSVRDYGTFTPPASRPAGLEGGRGFALMDRLVDEVDVRADHDGTTVTLSKARV